jgi:hypothetical protein
MKSIFGIAISDEGLFLCHLLDNNTQKDLLYTGRFEYPFEYRDDLVFDEHKFLRLSDIIVKQKEERQIEDLSIHFVLPYKFAYLKRIAIPSQDNLNLNRFQVEWDLSNYVNGELSSYKVMKADHSFEQKKFNEIVVFAIKKTLIKTLSQLASSCNAQLGSVILNNFSLENFLQNNGLITGDQCQLVFRIGKHAVESHFYKGGHYHSSILDNVNIISEESDPTQKFLSSIKENYQYFLNLREKVPYLNNLPLRVMIYGTHLSVELFAKIKSSFNTEITKLEIKNYPEYLTNSHNFIEAYGAAL